MYLFTHSGVLESKREKKYNQPQLRLPFPAQIILKKVGQTHAGERAAFKMIPLYNFVLHQLYSS